MEDNKDGPFARAEKARQEAKDKQAAKKKENKPIEGYQYGYDPFSNRWGWGWGTDRRIRIMDEPDPGRRR